MPYNARLPQTHFNPHGGVDLDALAERLDQHDADVEAVGLDFDAENDNDTPPERRNLERRKPKAIARFA